MTRDMVDGMGYSGTQGVFQRCAEETLRVLRERSDVIMTVLEVFKHDPLHSWFVPPFFRLFVCSSTLQDRERTQDQKDSGQHQRARRTRYQGKFTARAGSRPRGEQRARQRGGGPCAQLCGSQIGQVAQRRVYGQRAHRGGDGHCQPGYDLSRYVDEHLDPPYRRPDERTPP